MNEPIPDEYIDLLEEFIGLCKSHPSYIHDPALKFFKDYLISLGANIPSPEQKESESSSPKDEEIPKPSVPEGNIQSGEEDSEESEVELDQTGVIEPDDDEPLPQGDDSANVTEEKLEESAEKRMKASQELSEGNKDEAIRLLTESIMDNPQSAISYAKRAGVLLSTNKPNAVIRDCNKALVLNPDQALAYKYRGRAHRLLGNWEDAAKDLALACKLDYSDEANEWLKEVSPNVKKIQEHRRKYERKNTEKLLRKRRAQQKKMETDNKCNTENTSDDDGSSDFGGIFPPEMQEFLKDPEVIELFSDPEVAAVLNDVNSPGGLEKFYSHPKIAAVMSKIKAKLHEKKKSGFGGVED